MGLTLVLEGAFFVGWRLIVFGFVIELSLFVEVFLGWVFPGLLAFVEGFSGRHGWMMDGLGIRIWNVVYWKGAVQLLRVAFCCTLFSSECMVITL